MRNISNLLQTVLDDHLKFVMVISEVIGHSITDVQWIRVRSLLSPTSKFTIPDALNFSSLVVSKTKVIPTKVIWYEKRETLVFHVAYEFYSYDGASCTEFFLRGPRSAEALMIDMPGVTHQISVPNIKDMEISNIYGVVTVEKVETADTYSRLLELLFDQDILSDRNYYATINKSILTENL